ncbi:MAG: response regulator [Bacteroidales bacterium]|nr:response regulator [Bacteroidales bacterium]
MGRICLVISLCLSVLFVSGQDYHNLHFEGLNNTLGLLSDEVYTTVQDQEGFIWFGTSDGIVRYDGYEFNSFKSHPHLGKMYGMTINEIHVDKEGNFYVCGVEGFFAFNKYYESILDSVETFFEGRRLNDVLKASDGKVYLSSHTGFYIVNSENQQIKELHPCPENKMISNITRKMVEDSRGRIWISTLSNHIMRLNADGESFTSYKMSDVNVREGLGVATNSLFIDSRGYLWVGGWENGLFVLDISSENEVHEIKTFRHDKNNANTIPGDIIHSIGEDKYGGIWIGTPYGLSVIQYPFSQKHKVINFKPGDTNATINSTVVTNLLNDNSDILWIATKGGGIFKLVIERNKFAHLKIPNLNPQKRNQAVHCFETDHKERLLAGVLSIGFVVYDKKTDRFKHFSEVPEYKVLNDHLNLNTAYDLMWDRDSLLWIGTRYNGVVHLDVKSGKVDVTRRIFKWAEFRGRHIYAMHELQNGSVLVGTEDGLNILSRGGEGEWRSRYVVELRQKAAVRKGSFIITGIVDYKGSSVLVSTEKYGVFELSFSKGKAEVKTWNQIKDRIICLFRDKQERIWLGTKGKGLLYSHAQDSELHHLDANVNQMGDVVYGINQDRYDNLWVTTNNGLTKVTVNGMDFFHESYSHRDGLQGNVFLPRSFYKDDEGLFYVGGYNGFNKFEPHRVKSSYIKSPVAITEIRIEGETKDLSAFKDSIIWLDHNSNDLSIEFTSLCYTSPEANQYMYKIEGLDKDWKFASSKMRSANYSNIPPGDYVFMLKGSNSQGIWNNDVLEMNLKVQPAPYKSWWAIGLYFIAIAGIITFIFRQRLRLERIKQAMELEHVARVKSDKLHQYKLSFFTNISHELLTPVSILSTALYNIRKESTYSADNVEVMVRSVGGLERLIRQLLTFRKIESNRMTVSLGEWDASKVVEDCIRDFIPQAEKKGLGFKYDIERNVHGLIDKEKWELIIRNLMSNALKYTEKGEVIFSLHKQDDKNVLLEVSDTGYGIPEDALSRVFDRFYRVKGQSKVKTDGIGIGLNLTKSLVDILAGEITVESELNKGTRFKLILPIDGAYSIQENKEDTMEAMPDVEYIAKVEAESEKMSESVFNEQEVLNDKTILLVEDNEVFRESLKTAIGGYATILEAGDGEEGLAMAEKEEVDLIISDVMMPVKSGYELCKAIKSNIETSHIPVILITAKVGDNNKLQGYQSGANAYVEKPVNMNLLLARMQSLLGNMRKMRKETGSSLNLEPENVSVTPLDEAFFNKAKKLVEEHMANAEYSIKEFADDLGVSSSMLYRKMKSLADSSPSEFVRNIRLKRSAQMLENKSFTISEVAYNCGFNDLSYFGVCFKKMFGVTPTAFQEGERGESE